jgi:hypothetical protein
MVLNIYREYAIFSFKYLVNLTANSMGKTLILLCI